MNATKILSEYSTGLTKVILVSILELAVSFLFVLKGERSNYDMQWEKAYMKRIKGFDKSKDKSKILHKRLTVHIQILVQFRQFMTVIFQKDSYWKL